MDVLAKIKELQKERGWSTYKLSVESHLTQSTLSNMFARTTNPSIGTLSNLCDAFGITLSEFFADKAEDAHLTKEESEMIRKFRHLDERERKAVRKLIENLR